jgi:hypothetical protein
VRSRRVPLAAALVLVLGVLAGCSAFPLFPDPVSSPSPSVAGTPRGQEDEDFGTAVVYSVDAAGALDPAAADAATADVWDTFVRVVTPEFAGHGMSRYRVGDAPDSDTMAYVVRDEARPVLWVLAANLAYADDADLLFSTLVHEYGHILTLGLDDVDPDVRTCTTWEFSDGCVTAGSPIDAFAEEFWAPYGDAAPGPDEDDADAAYDFYLAHEEDFVSDYAATNVVEDIAESFMTFVLEPRPDGDTPVARKLDFFWQLPDFVAVRDRIRTEFALD